jgi:hypothetical protein
LRSPLHEDFVDASVRQFCASANARLQACADFDAKRQFLVGRVDRVIYNRYTVTIAGFVPVQSASGATKLQFRIEGEIDPKAVRSRPRTIGPEDGRWKEPILTSFSRSVVSDHDRPRTVQERKISSKTAGRIIHDRRQLRSC